ncbi:MAG: hypothetical protein Kow0099_38980 [Candidatus Abyssubacteria bacterium]
MKLGLGTAALILALSTGAAWADFEMSDWKHFKEIGLPEGMQSEYAFIQVDAEIYDGCVGGLHSLRIVDAGSREIPYQLVTKSEKVDRVEFFPTVLNNSQVPGEYNSFVLDFGEEPPQVNQVMVLTTSTNFTRRASVEGSNDQSEWHLLVDDAYIFDFSRDIKSSHLAVEFPLATYRFLRVKVFAEGGKALEIQGAKVHKVTKEEAQTERWPLSIIERAEDEKEKVTSLVLDSGYRALPIRSIELSVMSRNYHRHVRVHSSENRGKWTDLGSGVIYNYDVADIEKTDNRIAFRENQAGRYFKLIIRNYDDPPLDVSDAEGISLVRRVIVPLDGASPQRVYFGNPLARPPQYDLAYRMPYIETERLPRLSLGPRQSNPAYIEPPPSEPWSERHQYLLWGVMAIVSVFLAGLIYNLLRKTPPVANQ